MHFSEAAQLPIEISCKWADGTIERFSLPRLRMRDYAPWVDEESAKRREAAFKSIPANMNAMDRFRAQRIAENEVATLENIKPLVLSPKGADRVLDISLDRAGVPAEKRAKIIDVLPSGQAADLAVQLSTLFVIPELADAVEEKQGGKKSDVPFGQKSETVESASAAI